MSSKDTRLALWDGKPTGEGTACEQSVLYLFLFLFFFVLLPGVSSFFSPESIHWKVSVLHRAGVVDQSDLAGPHLSVSGVIYRHPVDAQNTFTSNCSWLTELKSTFLLSSPVLVPPVTIAAFRRARKGFWTLISFCPGIIVLSQNTIMKLMLQSFLGFFFMFYVVKSLLF